MPNVCLCCCCSGGGSREISKGLRQKERKREKEKDATRLKKMANTLCKKKEPLFIPFLTNKLQLIEVFVELSKIVVVVVPVASPVAAAAQR
jgi:hypothetical protein